MSRLHLLAALLLVPWVDGCADVPQVNFAADASADAPVDVRSGDAAETGPDAAPVDGGGCPDSAPPGAAWCCGSVPCKANSAADCQAECTNCENNCPGKTCCLDKHGNYQGCAMNPAACP